MDTSDKARIAKYQERIRDLDTQVQDLGERLAIFESTKEAKISKRWKDALEKIADGKGKYASVAREALDGK